MLCDYPGTLTPKEKRHLKAIATAGRERLGSYRFRNPVIVLTGKELFGQYKLGDFYNEYSVSENWVRRIFNEVDFKALAEFTQEQYLDMKPAHEVIGAKRAKRALKKLSVKTVANHA